jgi:hypothetical protein
MDFAPDLGAAMPAKVVMAHAAISASVHRAILFVITFSYGTCGNKRFESEAVITARDLTSTDRSWLW